LQNDKTVSRPGIYRILAAAFSRPKPEISGLYRSILEVHAILQPTEGSIVGLHATDSMNLATLAPEHLRLFVGPGHIPCPPYEAVYRKDRPDFERGLVMGPSTADVRRTYLEAGLDISKSYTDLPDHVSAEMEFMQFLCAEEERLAQEGSREEAAKLRRTQREFHKNHIEPWVGDFADCVLRSTNSSFYKAAATVLKEFAKKEADYFGSG